MVAPTGCDDLAACEAAHATILGSGKLFPVFFREVRQHARHAFPEAELGIPAGLARNRLVPGDRGCARLGRPLQAQQTPKKRCRPRRARPTPTTMIRIRRSPRARNRLPRKPSRGRPATNSAQMRKIVPNEVFRDPIAEKLLDVDNFKPITKPAVTLDELRQFKAIAGGVDANVDKGLIERVIDAMVAKLTDRTNIQALIDSNAKINPNSTTAHAIQEAPRP